MYIVVLIVDDRSPFRRPLWSVRPLPATALTKVIMLFVLKLKLKLDFREIEIEIEHQLVNVTEILSKIEL